MKIVQRKNLEKYIDKCFDEIALKYVIMHGGIIENEGYRIKYFKLLLGKARNFVIPFEKGKFEYISYKDCFIVNRSYIKHYLKQAIFDIEMQTLNN